MKNKIILLTAFILIPLVRAQECGLLNLASCIPEKIYDFIINIINSPIAPLLDFTRILLTEPVRIRLFLPLWAIIIYVISLFYGILMLYSGFNFIFSGHNAVKRAKAKEWFMNVFIMIVLVQASFFIYELIIDLESLLTSGVFNLIDEHFFMLTADNIVNIGLQFFLGFSYVIVLIITVIILIIRYIIVAVGVVFFPIGIFFYFIPPLNSYGRLIFNFLGVCIFITFFNSLIFLISSQLIQIDLFNSFKIMLMISSFLIANIIMLFLFFFSIIKSAITVINKTEGSIMSVAKYFI